MFIDSHCHLDRLDLTPHDNQFGRFVQATLDGGVTQMLCVAIDLESYPAMRELVDPYPQISVSVGVHPNEHSGREPDEAELVQLGQDPRVVAIGETGLDYYRSEGDCTWQQLRFRRHIHAARSLGKPLIIHTREAREDTLRVLREEDAGSVGGVFHCFTEDWDTAKAALDLNFYISFSGIISFASAEQIREVARKVPEDRFLIETDSPYLAPTPFRGKPNYPLYVKRVAECIAELRGKTVQDVARQSGKNYHSLFG